MSWSVSRPSRACNNKLVGFYFVALGRKCPCHFGNGSHIPHDFSFSFIIHFTPGKQHSRRFPQASMSQAFSIRRLRVSGCLAEVIEKIQLRRAIGVMSSHPACATGAAARAFRRSAGTLSSGSSPTRAISTVTMSTSSPPAPSRIVLLTLSQWLPLLSGSRAARNGKALIVPSTIVVPRDGSFALAFLGRVRAHDPGFWLPSARNNFALNRMVGLVACALARFISGGIYNETRNLDRRVVTRTAVCGRIRTILGPDRKYAGKKVVKA